MNNKAQINQIFVYILSVIIILFIGFIVVKFISGFSDAPNELQLEKTFDNIKDDYDEIYVNYGDEISTSYKTANQINYVCFIQKEECIDNLDELSDTQKESLKTVFKAGDNIIQFDSNDIVASDNLNKFFVKEECMCAQTRANSIRIIIENRKNDIWIINKDDLEIT